MSAGSTLAAWCQLGIKEVLVLSGDAQQYELKNPPGCPGLKVAYNERQDISRPLTKRFLAFFDSWIRSARKDQKKIVIRSSAGSFAASRLAAYYGMKFQKKSSEGALDLVRRQTGSITDLDRLIEEVYALEDHIKKRRCRYSGSVKQIRCVTE